jgi:hypothetical protein
MQFEQSNLSYHEVEKINAHIKNFRLEQKTIYPEKNMKYKK